MDAYEVDNTQALAKAITVGVIPQQHTMHAALNYDWVKFPAKAGGTYVIDNPGYQSSPRFASARLDGSGDMRVVLELFDSSGAVLARSQGFVSRDFTNGPSRFMAEQIVWKAPKAQTVYVRVSSFPDRNYDQTGAYLLQVRSVVPQITGKVTTPDGKPAAYAYVSADSGSTGLASKTAQPSVWSAAEALTDENGGYVLFGLDDGNYQVHFDGFQWMNSSLQGEAYDDVHDNDTDAPKLINVGGMKQTTGIDAQLDLGAEFISGRVVDEDGNGVEGIDVMPYTFYSWGSYWYFPSWDYSATTDADGYYVCRNGYNGTWRLGFVDNTDNMAYVSEFWNDTPDVDSASNIVVSGGSAAGSYDATLTGIPELAHGLVTNTAGDPLDGILVMLYDLSGNNFCNVYTDADGTWNAHLAGEYSKAKIKFMDNGDSYYATQWYDNKPDQSSSDTVTLGPGSPTLSTIMVAEKPSLTGVVTDAKTGAKAAGVQVWLYDYTGTNWFPIDSTVTDANGAYSFQTVRNSEFVVKYYDSTGFFTAEYYNNVSSPFRASWQSADVGSDLKINASLQPQGDRVYGMNRFGTAVAAAKQTFPEWAGVQDVIVASGDDAAAADPLASASLSWAYNAPLLLTRKSGTPAETLVALREIDAAAGGTLRIHVVGGPGSVPDARLSEMAAVVGAADLERLPYGNRYETARQIALRVHDIAVAQGKDPGVVFVANGSESAKFVDALSASAISARTGAPILFTTTGDVPSATKLALGEVAADTVYVVGGNSSVPESAYTQTGADARLAGRDRYETSVMLAKFGGEKGWLSYTQIGLAAALPDGMTGGVAMGLLGGPLLITHADYLPNATYKFIDDNDQFIEHAVVFGGSTSVAGAISQSVKRALRQ